MLAWVLEAVTATAPAWVRQHHRAFIAVDVSWADVAPVVCAATSAAVPDVAGAPHDGRWGRGECFAGNGALWRVVPSLLAADTASLVTPFGRDDGRYRVRAIAEVALPPRRSLEALAGCSPSDTVAAVRAWQQARGSLGHDPRSALGLVRAVLGI